MNKINGICKVCEYIVCQCKVKPIRKEFKEFVGKWAESSAEQHCQAYKDRYFTKSKEQIEEDLYINHDESGEYEFIKEEFGEATEEEKEFYLERFRKECLKYMGYEEE